jgi:hypothetical protein
VKLTLALLIAGLSAGAALAQDTPPKPVAEVWATGQGTMTIAVLPFSLEGTYDQDNGRIVASKSGDAMVGYWGEDSSSTECPTELLGTKYWGRVNFTFDAARTHFDGKWSYCDADPDSEWSGDIAK